MDERKRELELEVREHAVIGETRIVWGCGGEAESFLFCGEFIGINIRNVPDSWSLKDVRLALHKKLSRPDAIRDLFFTQQNPGRGKRSARIVFGCPQIASTSLKVFN